MGYSPRGHKESDTIEKLSTHSWTVAHWLLCLWDPPVKNNRVHCHFLHQGIFPTQGLKPEFLAFTALAGGFFTTLPVHFSSVQSLSHVRLFATP